MRRLLFVIIHMYVICLLYLLLFNILSLALMFHSFGKICVIVINLFIFPTWHWVWWFSLQTIFYNLENSQPLSFPISLLCHSLYSLLPECPLNKYWDLLICSLYLWKTFHLFKYPICILSEFLSTVFQSQWLPFHSAYKFAVLVLTAYL